MAKCLIALGGNVGDTQQQFAAALAELDGDSDLALLRQSRWRRTSPVGGPADQADYLNGAALLETNLAPLQVWERLLRTEARLGRRRQHRWGPRSIDLDLLLYDNWVLTSPALRVPHPRMAFRRFVVDPAAETAPDMAHPEIGWSLQRLANHLQRSKPRMLLCSIDQQAARLAALASTELSADMQLQAACGPVVDHLDQDSLDEDALHEDGLHEDGLDESESFLQVWQPRFLRFDEPEPPQLTVFLEPSLTGDVGRRVRWASWFRRLATAPGRGPFWCLPPRSMAETLSELKAAGQSLL